MAAAQMYTLDTVFTFIEILKSLNYKLRQKSTSDILNYLYILPHQVYAVPGGMRGHCRGYTGFLICNG